MSNPAIQESSSQSNSIRKTNWRAEGKNVRLLSAQLANIGEPKNVYVLAEDAVEEFVERVLRENIRAVVVAPSRPQVHEMAFKTVKLEPSAVFHAGMQRVSFPNGSTVDLVSSDNDAYQLRGPNYHLAWAHAPHMWDEYTWDMLQFCLRLGPNPEIIMSAQ